MQGVKAASEAERIAATRDRHRRSRALHPNTTERQRAWPWQKAYQAVHRSIRTAVKYGLDAATDITKEVMARIHLLPCHYCGVMPAMGADHFVPLSRNGLNMTSNLVPACWSCNHDKRDFLRG